MKKDSYVFEVSFQVNFEETVKKIKRQKLEKEIETEEINNALIEGILEMMACIKQIEKGRIPKALNNIKAIRTKEE